MTLVPLHCKQVSITTITITTITTITTTTITITTIITTTTTTFDHDAHTNYIILHYLQHVSIKTLKLHISY